MQFSELKFKDEEEETETLDFSSLKFKEEEPSFMDDVTNFLSGANGSPEAINAQALRDQQREEVTELSESSQYEDIDYRGNIDLDSRKVLREGDTIKTENSITIELEDNKFALIPTVIDGKQVTEKEAVKHASKTQQHLGIYDTIKEADEAAAKISNRQGQKYGGKGTPGAKRWTMDKIFEQEESEELDTEIGDYGASVMAGFAGLGETVSYYDKEIAQKIGDKEGEESAKERIQYSKETKEFWKSYLSEDAIKAGEKELMAPSAAETLHNIMNNPQATALSVMESLPATAAGMVVGGIFGKAFKLIPGAPQFLADTLGFGAGEGAVAAGQGGLETEEKVRKMPMEKLEKSPEYQIALGKTGDPDKAREYVAEAAGGDAAARTFIFTAALGAPLGGLTGKFLRTGSFTPKGGASSIAVGTVGEGAQETLQSGEEVKSQNIAIKKHADPSQDIMEGVDEARLKGGLAGMAMGGTMATGGAIYQAYSTKVQTEIREEKIKKDLPDSGAEFVTPEEEEKMRKEDARIRIIQSRFSTIMGMYADIDVPSDVMNDIDLQEKIVNEYYLWHSVEHEGEQEFWDKQEPPKAEPTPQEEERPSQELTIYSPEQKAAMGEDSKSPTSEVIETNADGEPVAQLLPPPKEEKIPGKEEATKKPKREMPDNRKAAIEYKASDGTQKRINRADFNKLTAINNAIKAGKPLTEKQKALREEHIEYFDTNRDEFIKENRYDDLTTGLDATRDDLSQDDLAELQRQQDERDPEEKKGIAKTRENVEAQRAFGEVPTKPGVKVAPKRYDIKGKVENVRAERAFGTPKPTKAGVKVVERIEGIKKTIQNVRGNRDKTSKPGVKIVEAEKKGFYGYKAKQIDRFIDKGDKILSKIHGNNKVLLEVVDISKDRSYVDVRRTTNGSVTRMRADEIELPPVTKRGKMRKITDKLKGEAKAKFIKSAKQNEKQLNTPEPVGKDGLTPTEANEFMEINDKENRSPEEEKRLSDLMDKVEATFPEEVKAPKKEKWVEDAKKLSEEPIKSEEQYQRAKEHLKKLEATYATKPIKSLADGLKLRKKKIDQYEAKRTNGLDRKQITDFKRISKKKKPTLDERNRMQSYSNTILQHNRENTYNNDVQERVGTYWDKLNKEEKTKIIKNLQKTGAGSDINNFQDNWYDSAFLQLSPNIKRSLHVINEQIKEEVYNSISKKDKRKYWENRYKEAFFEKWRVDEYLNNHPENMTWAEAKKDEDFNSYDFFKKEVLNDYSKNKKINSSAPISTPRYSKTDYQAAYDAMETAEKTTKGTQGTMFGQSQLFDTDSKTELAVPKWAKGIVSDTLRYEDIVTAITNAKNGTPTALSDRALQAMEKEGIIADQESKDLKKEQGINGVEYLHKYNTSKQAENAAQRHNAKNGDTVYGNDGKWLTKGKSEDELFASYKHQPGGTMSIRQDKTIELMRKLAGSPKIIYHNYYLKNEENGKYVAGMYLSKKHEIHISKGFHENYWTLVHEVVHAKYHNLLMTNEEFAAGLEEIVEAAYPRSKNKKAYGWKKKNGKSSEFLSEFFSDPDLRAEMNEMPYDGNLKLDAPTKPKTWLEAIIAWFKQFWAAPVAKEYKTVTDAVFEFLDRTKDLEPDVATDEGAVFAEFKSRLTEAIESKMPKRTSTTTVMNILNKGATKDEIKWSGVFEFLQGKKTVTKEEVLGAINTPKLETKELNSLETTYADLPKGKDDFMLYDTDEESETSNYMFTVNNYTIYADEGIDDIHVTAMNDDYHNNTDFGYAKNWEEVVLLLQDAVSQEIFDEQNDTKFSGYMTKGVGKNYREQLTVYTPPMDLKIEARSKAIGDELDTLTNQYNESLRKNRAAKENLKSDSPNWKKFIDNDIKIRDEYQKAFNVLADEQHELSLKRIKQSSFFSNHWDNENVLYHKRLQDVMIEDDESLHIEELQSDWHQEGRKKGYEPENKAELEKRRLEIEDKGKSATSAEKGEWANIMNILQPNMPNKVPQAPFSKTWHEKGMKDIIGQAVDGNYDRVSWTTGKEQAERYNLSKQIKELDARKRSRGWDVRVKTKQGEDRLVGTALTDQQLADTIGKEMAEKVISDEKAGTFNYPAQKANIYTGLDLEVGGEGMKTFYDKMLPKWTNKYIKKYGSKVEIKKLKNGEDVWTFKVTPKMKEKIEEEGQPLYSPSINPKAKTTSRRGNTSHKRNTSSKDPGTLNPDDYPSRAMPQRPADNRLDIGMENFRMPNRVIFASEIRNLLTDLVGSRMYQGNIHKRKAGHYSPRGGEIRQQNLDDVAVTGHEIYHFIHREMQTPEITEFIENNDEEIRRYAYPSAVGQPVELEEGMAELMRAYLTQSQFIIDNSYGLYEDLEKALESMGKKRMKKIKEIQRLSHLFYNQGAEASNIAAIVPLPTAWHRKTFDEITHDLSTKLKDFGYKGKKDEANMMVTQYIDLTHPVKLIMADIGLETGLTAKNPYIQFRLATGHTESVVEAVAKYGTPIVGADGSLEFSGESLGYVFKDVLENTDRPNNELMNDLYRYFQLEQAAYQVEEQGKKTAFHYGNIIEELYPMRSRPGFEEAWNRMQAFNDRMLNFYVSANYITKDQKAKFQEEHPLYVPTHRVIAENQSTGRSKGIKQRSRLGSERQLLGVDNIFAQLENHISGALLANAKTTLFKATMNNPDGAKWVTHIKKRTERYKAMREQQASHFANMLIQEGLTLDENDNIVPVDQDNPQWIGLKEGFMDRMIKVLKDNPSLAVFYTFGNKPLSKDGNIQSALINDNMEYFEINRGTVNGALLNEMFNGIETTYERDLWMKWGHNIKNFTTRAIVAMPDFILGNLWVDTTSAGVYTKTNFIPGVDSAAGAKSVTTEDETFQNFVLNGGAFGTRVEMTTQENRKRQMMKLSIKEKSVARVLNSYDRAVSVGEMATRVGEYRNGISRGLDPTAAAFLGTEITTDFNMHGSNHYMNALRSLVPFLPASINSIYKDYREFGAQDVIAYKAPTALIGRETKAEADKKRKKDIKKKKITQYSNLAVKGFAYITIPAIVSMLLKSDDDDEKEKPVHEEAMFSYYQIGDTEYKTKTQYWLGLIFEKAPKLAMMAFKEDQGEKAVEIAKAGLWIMLVPEATPGAVAPFIDIARNKKFTGAPIISDSDKALSEEDVRYQFKARTPELYKKASMKLGEQGINVSPLIIEHITKSYMGYVAKWAEDGFQRILWDESLFGEMPDKDLLSHLNHHFKYKDYGQTYYSQKYYDAKDKIASKNRLISLAKRYRETNRKELAKEILEDVNIGLVKASAKRLRAADKFIGFIRTQEIKIKYDKNMSSKEKDEKLLKLHNRIGKRQEQEFKALEKQLKAGGM